MTAVPTASLLKMIRYLRDAEFKHYAERLREGRDDKDHIYKHVLIVAEWLRTRDEESEIYANAIIQEAGRL
jgi:hypothetical protein